MVPVPPEPLRTPCPLSVSVRAVPAVNVTVTEPGSTPPPGKVWRTLSLGTTVPPARWVTALSAELM